MGGDSGCCVDESESIIHGVQMMEEERGFGEFFSENFFLRIFFAFARVFLTWQSGVGRGAVLICGGLVLVCGCLDMTFDVRGGWKRTSKNTSTPLSDSIKDMWPVA